MRIAREQRLVVEHRLMLKKAVCPWLMWSDLQTENSLVFVTASFELEQQMKLLECLVVEEGFAEVRKLAMEVLFSDK